MGATGYVKEIETRDICKVFHSLVEDAKELYGDNPYNDSISTTSLNIVFHFADKYGKRVASKFNKVNSDKFYPGKRETNAVNLGLVGYQPYSVNFYKLPVLERRVRGEHWTNEYAIQDNITNNVMSEINGLTKAKQYAKEYIKSHENDVDIMRKRSNGLYVPIMRIQLVENGKLAHTKRTSKTKIYIPKYHYVLFIVASC